MLYIVHVIHQIINILISGSDDSTIRIWSSIAFELVHTLVGHTDGILSVGCSSDRKRIISGGYDCSIKIWDIETGKMIKSWIAHDDNILSMCYSLDDKYIISGGIDRRNQNMECRNR